MISSEKSDAFNVPVFAPSVQEFKKVIKADGSFHINKLQFFKGGSPFVLDQPDDDAEVGRALASTCMTVTGVLVDAHIGEWLREELFSRVEMPGNRSCSQKSSYTALLPLSLSIQNSDE
ncbi:hypothetical protein MLD38_000559 [Melastoma candidum]|uniref:Uncharacterized protein n=1 Tax=Melastoma candidum TaxID=119954 RepID=A0ACB9SJ33_9MYRT|nr:hypothetical protein MLD38_000559 [Melastoma candidum]